MMLQQRPDSDFDADAPVPGPHDWDLEDEPGTLLMRLRYWPHHIAAWCADVWTRWKGPGDPEALPGAETAAKVSLRSLLFAIITRPVTAPFRWLHGWWIHGLQRPGAWRLLCSAPTLVLLLAAGILALSATIRSTTDLRGRYIRAAQESGRAGDYEAARIYYDRAIELGEASPETLWELALTLDKLDNQQRVRLLLDELAPSDRAGLPRAHLWRAKRLLGSGTATHDRLRQAAFHLRTLLDAEPHRIEGHAMLGALLLSTGHYEQGISHLTLCFDKQPHLRLQVAQAYVRLGNREMAASLGRQAEQYFLARLNEDPAHPTYWLRAAESKAFLDKYPEAVQLLLEGTARQPQIAAALRSGLARVHLAWLDWAQRQPQRDLEREVDLLVTAFQYNPHELQAFPRAMRLLTSGEASSQQLREKLHAMLLEGQSTPVAHLLLGTDAGLRGDFDRAVRHLEHAVRLNPQLGIAVNNLAEFLRRQDPPQLDRALSLMDQLVGRWPDNALFRETRGQILAQMGRWEPSVADLEFALSRLPEHVELRATLAEAYQQLGMHELAELQLERAAELQRRVGQRVANPLPPSPSPDRPAP